MFDESLSFSQKEQILRYLMRCYRLSTNRINRFEVCHCVKENQQTYYQDKTTQLLVEDALRELSEDEQRIIRFDYMMPRKDYWYLEFFSKSTYYRLKSKAVDKFLRCLHA